MSTLPIFYSFRRCPYAMRARLAISISGVQTELREVVLRDKPPSMIEVSPKATVPVLALSDGKVLEESREVMLWALEQNDPEEWLGPWRQNRHAVEALFELADGPFKHHLDRYKYPGRYVDEKIDPEVQRADGLKILLQWNDQLGATGWLLEARRTIADMAILPFVRQFSHVDKGWFDAQTIPHVQKWLEDFLVSPLFQSIMKKYDPWQEGLHGILFPETAS